MTLHPKTPTEPPRLRWRRRLVLACLPVAIALALAVGASSAFAAGRPTILGNSRDEVVVELENGVFEEGRTYTYPSGATFMTPEVSIAPNGLETNYSFEYATNEQAVKERKGTPVPGGSGTLAPSAGTEGVAVKLTGLAPETVYYLRAVATNADGTVVTQIRSNKTESLSPRLEGIGVSQITETSAHVFIVVYTHLETEYGFEYATTATGPWSRVTGGTAAASEAAQNPEGVLSGLNPRTVYYVRAFAKNAHGEQKSETYQTRSFETLGPPNAETFAVHALEGETLRALGSVVPHGFDTHYRFQYVTQSHFEAEGFANPAETSAAEAGSGGESGVEPVTVGQDLPGLEQGVTYHFRLAASNTAAGNPVAYGEEQTLTVPVPGLVEAGEEEGTQPAVCPNEEFRTGPSAHLPDCRAYELVTPPDKGGAQDIFNYGATAATSVIGEDGERVAVQTVAKWGASSDNILSTYDLARTSAGWQMTSVTPQPEAGEETYRPDIFSSDLTQLAFVTYTQTKDGPRGHSPTQQFRVGPPGGPYTDVTATVFNQGGEGGPGEDEWVGGSDDGSKLILRTVDHELLRGHPTGTVGAEAYDLYEYADGQLRQLNVTTGGAPISTCGAALPNGFETYEGFVVAPLERHNIASRHAVSADGDRVFFIDNCTHDLYMRVNGAETIDIGAYNFVAADPAGTRVLLEGQSGRGLFLYETESATLRPLAATSGLGAMEAEKFIVSEDLTAFYLEEGESLYRYDIADEKFSFIAQAEILTSTGGGFSTTPDGRYFYFVSHHVGGLPSSREEQVYRYDSVAKAIQCMSCASPFDPEPKLASVFVTEGAQERLGTITNNGSPLERVSSDNGDYVFFDTPNALVPQDVNGEEPLGLDPGHSDTDFSESSDVYEWRKNGIDGCAHVQGCLSLITNGRDGSKNLLLGTTPSGRDVFFATHSQLVPQDTDSSGDVYDARIGGGLAPPESPPVECEGDACSTPAGPPNDATPSSLTFSGMGNLLSEPPAAVVKARVKGKALKCAKGRTASHGRCVKAKLVKRKGKRGKGSRATSRKGGAR
jgi:hypothetical protein